MTTKVSPAANFIKKLFLLAMLAFNVSACAPVSNEIVGFTPNNPSTSSKADAKTKSVDIVSMANHKSVSAGGYKISASLGDQLSGHQKTTQSGNYKVSFTVQGQLDTIK